MGKSTKRRSFRAVLFFFLAKPSAGFALISPFFAPPPEILKEVAPRQKHGRHPERRLRSAREIEIPLFFFSEVARSPFRAILPIREIQVGWQQPRPKGLA